MKYNLIYADPAWSYSQKSAGRGNKSGAKDKYGTMTLEAIKELPIGDITQDNAILFMWATVPLLPSCLEVMPSWGFEYKTLIVWHKTGSLGMGNWVRVQTEFLLVGLKGRIEPFKLASLKNIIEGDLISEAVIAKHRIGKHSEKPSFFRGLVSEVGRDQFGDKLNKLELFARSDKNMFPDEKFKDNWHVWGNEVNNSITI